MRTIKNSTLLLIRLLNGTYNNLILILTNHFVKEKNVAKNQKSD